MIKRIKRQIARIMDHHRTAQRLKQLKARQKKLQNTDFTIFANNCVGGAIYKDLELKFLTPIIDLYFFAPDYVKFLSDPDYYLSIDMICTEKSKWGTFDYPIGLLDDIELHFLHYNTYEDAKKKWEERKKRINKNNLFVIGSEKYFCTPEIIAAFDSLPYENKIFFSTKKYPNINSAIWLEEYQNELDLPDIIPERLWLKYIDLIAWLNKEKNYIK